MPTPERKPGQTSWARRQQQQQQQHNSPGPFGRARRDPLRLDALEDHSPIRESPARSRAKFNQTGTLRGAFDHTSSRLPLAEIEGGDLFLPEHAAARRGSPRQRRRSANVMSPRSNNPEIAEVYRQIDEAESLTDVDQSDDENSLFGNAHKFSNTPRSSSKRFSTGSEASFTSGSPRPRFTDGTKDEERLRRATTGRSPVFDRNAIGGGPSSEHLQRRDSEPASSEEDYGIEPSVRAPATWGSRARSGSNWMKSLTRNHERGADSTMEEPAESPSRIMDEISARHAQQAAEKRNIVEDRPVLRYSPPPERNEDSFTNGQNIPNTPITTYPGSTFTKRSPTKRDSHDLIQKLTRARSPSANLADANQTPMQTTTEKHVYDKTPAAPGAWIYTPMTQRVPQSQPKEVIEALDPKLGDAWDLNKKAEPPSRAESESGGLLQKINPFRSNDKEKPPAEEPKNPVGNSVSETLKDEQQPKEELSKAANFKAESEGEQLPSETKSKQDIRVEKQESKRVERELKRKWTPSELPLPEHPKSALETVLQDKESLDVGDDTLESLEAILEQEAGDDTKDQEKNDAAYEQQVIEQLESAHGSQTDMNDMKRIDNKLQSLADSMSHIRSGLNELENQMSRDNTQAIASLRDRTDKPESKPGLATKCETCNKGKSIVVQNGIPFPRLWDRGDVWWMTRPTRLGWCILIPLLWYFSESTMSDLYSHPFVDTKCEGYCLMPDAPRFPFVIPTMLWRWLHLSNILVPLWTIVVAFGRIFAQLMGLSDGYVDDDFPKINLTGKVWVNGTPIADLGSAAAPPTTTTTTTTTYSIPTAAPWPWMSNHDSEPTPEVAAEAGSGDPWDDVSMDEDEFL